MAAEAPITGGRLVVLTDGREYEIAKTPFVIGRDAVSQLVLPGRQVSRRHAEIAATSHGYLLIDRSSNGTDVNGKPVDGQCLLSSGDVITCGGHDLRFYTGATPPPPGPPAPKAAPGAQQRLSNTMHGIPAMPPPGAQQRLSNTMHGVPAVPPPGAQQRLSNTMHGMPAVPPPGAQQRLSNTMHGMPVGPPLATLIVRGGSLKGQRFPVRTPVTNIGRGEYNDVVLADHSVSTVHAKLQRREGIWVLVDLDSTNGTTVDGQRVAGEAPLASGAEVRFGDVCMLFEPTDDGVQAQPGGGTRVMDGIDGPPAPEGPAAE